jgi:hypothetical protein
LGIEEATAAAAAATITTIGARRGLAAIFGDIGDEDTRASPQLKRAPRLS